MNFCASSSIRKSRAVLSRSITATFFPRHPRNPIGNLVIKTRTSTVFVVHHGGTIMSLVNAHKAKEKTGLPQNRTMPVPFAYTMNSKCAAPV